MRGSTGRWELAAATTGDGCDWLDGCCCDCCCVGWKAGVRSPDAGSRTWTEEAFHLKGKCSE